MRWTSRRSLLRALGAVGAAGLAGCSADADTDTGGTSSLTATATGTPTATAEPTPPPTAEPTPSPTPGPDPRGGYEGRLGFEPMLRATPTHPEAPDLPVLWARYVDVGGVLADVEDENHAGRLREGWLGSGPPRSTESDAFELVHLQPGNRSNLTFGYGDFEHAAAVEAMRADGWTVRDEAVPGSFDLLTVSGYTAAVGESSWVVVSALDVELTRQIAASVGTDPFVSALDDVDREAMSRAAAETGEYRVLERSTMSDGYAAGIALNFGAYRAPVGVMHLAPGRGTAWERVEERFFPVPGEVRTDDFDGEEPVIDVEADVPVPGLGSHPGDTV